MSLELSVVVPAFNESKGIVAHLNQITIFLKDHKILGEVIVVDDGSQDDTVSHVQGFIQKHPEVRLIRLPKNRGKGCAVRTGLLKAKGKVIGFTDADAATPITELRRILPIFQNQQADLVIGSRAKVAPDAKVKAHLHRKIIGRVFNFILMTLVGVRDRDQSIIKDTQCGYKWMTREAGEKLLAKMTIDGFAFDVEMLYLANRNGLRIAEVPVNWADRDESRVNLFIDPIKMFWQVLWIPFRHRS